MEAVAETDLDPEHINWHVEEYIQEIEWDELDQYPAGELIEFHENNGFGVVGVALFLIAVILVFGLLAGGLALFRILSQL